MQVLAENNILDEHALNLDTPASSNILNDFPNRLCNLFAALDHVLKDTGTNNVTKGGLGTFNKSLADVGDTKSGLMGRHNVIVDDGGQAQSNIVLGHANLLGHLCNLDLDVDLDEPFAEGVDLDQAGIDCLVETTELGDKTDLALVDVLVRVRADDAARNSTQSSNA